MAGSRMVWSLALVIAMTGLLPADVATQNGTIPFPPRDQAFDFRVNHLESKYRDGLRRPANTTFVDVEGEIVWTQEYLRYRVNGLTHTDATNTVRGEIDRVTGFPGLLDFKSFPLVAFPPRNDSFSFRQELERIYRDRLRRLPVTTFVDMEGALVWTQQYLLHRANGCAHLESVQKVLDEIDGRVPVLCPGTIPPCSFEITSFSRSFPQAGGSGEFTVRTQAGCTWYAERSVSTEDYVSLGENIRNGTQSVTYTVRPNTTGAARSGQLIIRESPTNRLLFSHIVQQS
jgi:hypothetical protein